MTRALSATTRMVPSGSPEAATMTSASSMPERPSRPSRVRPRAAASFRRGRMIEIVIVRDLVRRERDVAVADPGHTGEIGWASVMMPCGGPSSHARLHRNVRLQLPRMARQLLPREVLDRQDAALLRRALHDGGD